MVQHLYVEQFFDTDIIRERVGCFEHFWKNQAARLGEQDSIRASLETRVEFLMHFFSKHQDVPTYTKHMEELYAHFTADAFQYQTDINASEHGHIFYQAFRSTFITSAQLDRIITEELFVQILERCLQSPTAENFFTVLNGIYQKAGRVSLINPRHATKGDHHFPNKEDAIRYAGNAGAEYDSNSQAGHPNSYLGFLHSFAVKAADSHASPFFQSTDPFGESGVRIQTFRNELIGMINDSATKIAFGATTDATNNILTSLETVFTTFCNLMLLLNDGGQFAKHTATILFQHKSSMSWRVYLAHEYQKHVLGLLPNDGPFNRYPGEYEAKLTPACWGAIRELLARELPAPVPGAIPHLEPPSRSQSRADGARQPAVLPPGPDTVIKENIVSDTHGAPEQSAEADARANKKRKRNTSPEPAHADASIVMVTDTGDDPKFQPPTKTEIKVAPLAFLALLGAVVLFNYS